MVEDGIVGNYHRLQLWSSGTCPPFRCHFSSDYAMADLLPYADPESLHLPIQVAALEAEELSGVAYVVAGFFNLLQDVLALIGVASLLER